MERKSIFDAVRKMLGRGFTQAEVRELDAAIDAATGKAASSWLDLAVPLIQRFEGFAKVLPDGRVEAYPDPGTGGAPWTIGWGSTGPDIGPGTVWTREQAEERFRRDVAHFGNGVEGWLGDAPATDAQLAAMVSLAYNVGLQAFGKSTLLRKHKADDYAGAAAEFGKWVNANGRKMPGLVKRRAAEAALYEGRS